MKKLYLSSAFILMIVFALSNIQSGMAGVDNAGGLNFQRNNSGIDISPLVTSNLVNIRFKDQQSLQSVKIIVFDMLGNIVPKNQIMFLNENMMSLNLSNCQPGYYFIRVQTSNAVVTKRVSLISAKIALSA
ncbi:MAG TPA: T9SS type A sorting domain-containing protein [Bacteroidia bacterium]|nr:T9SS type A sorting domain-containing protein [Bacteroidia bacterium]HNT79853.1 T9SS type A sorting domain-containing protein [Bacteroidia bacterium]